MFYNLLSEILSTPNSARLTRCLVSWYKHVFVRPKYQKSAGRATI